MNAPVTVFQSQRVAMVKNLRPGLPERGKIKIGIKGEFRNKGKDNEFQLPQKLDHFVITTLTRNKTDNNFQRDEELHKLYGDKPTEIPVRLLYNDLFLNFQTNYTAFVGKTRWCVGDGEFATRLDEHGKPFEVECPCERLGFGYAGKDKCKINGTLSVVIEGAEVIGGVWKLRTTSLNTCQGILSSLAMISGMTGGVLAGIPLVLTLAPKTATTPEGAATTVYVVGLEFRGSVDALREMAHRQAISDASYGQRMQRIEDDARRLIEAPRVGGADLETVEEFYPDAAQVAHGFAPVSASPPHDPETGEVLGRAREELVVSYGRLLLDRARKAFASDAVTKVAGMIKGPWEGQPLWPQLVAADRELAGELQKAVREKAKAHGIDLSTVVAAGAGEKPEAAPEPALPLGDAA
jgi:hypothetical protein